MSLIGGVLNTDFVSSFESPAALEVPIIQRSRLLQLPPRRFLMAIVWPLPFLLALNFHIDIE